MKSGKKVASILIALLIFGVLITGCTQSGEENDYISEGEDTKCEITGYHQ